MLKDLQTFFVHFRHDDLQLCFGSSCAPAQGVRVHTECKTGERLKARVAAGVGHEVRVLAGRHLEPDKAQFHW